ncbi:MAG: hypothetical protein GXO23_06470 [Crenarchaeota archaeon]|nr:hypothetical protein [Thermoproteota archaeon]
MEQLVWCIISGLITLALATMVLGITFKFMPRGVVSVSAYSYKDVLIVSVRVFGGRRVYLYGVELVGKDGSIVSGCDITLARLGGTYVSYGGGRFQLPSSGVLRLYYVGYGCRYVYSVVVKTSVGDRECEVVSLEVSH